MPLVSSNSLIIVLPNFYFGIYFNFKIYMIPRSALPLLENYKMMDISKYEFYGTKLHGKN